MNHQIKINRARKIWYAGGPVRDQAVWAQIPQALIEHLTAAELAMVCRAINAAHAGGRRVESQSILAEGAIWDGSKMAAVGTT